MKNILAALFLLFPTVLMAQDATYITKGVGKFTGKTLQLLVKCNESGDLALQLKLVTDQMFQRAYPDDSYLAYRELYKKHYDIGVAEAEVEFKEVMGSVSEKALCEKLVADANNVISASNMLKQTKEQK
jgi:hypothetical protein